MFIDARAIPDGSVVEADVCIVGAGAAGITIAHELRNTALRVALLESGSLSADEATQSLYAGDVQERSYFSLDSTRTRARYFGGTTNEWAGECRPLDTLDFEPRGWVPDSGWPFGLAELLPFYLRAQSVVQLGPSGYTAADWREHGLRPLAASSGDIGVRILQYSPPTRFGELYRNEIAAAHNIAAYLGANVVDIETPASPSRVTAVKVACLGGSAFRARGRLFILAAGGIENARLLLMANSVHSAGLGNAHDLVGRCFMEHLYLDHAAVVRAREGTIDRFWTDGYWSEGRRVRALLGLSPELQRRERLTNFSAVLDEQSLRSAMRSLRSSAGLPRHLLDVVEHFGVTVAERLKLVRSTRLPRFYWLKNVMEQAPNRESRVVLGHEEDRLGCPRVVLRWRLSAIDKHTAHRAHEVLDGELRRAGVGRLHSSLANEAAPWPAALRGARHHMGTTRMHADPRRGVVDANGRVHGIANLYVAGSSVFPTSGSANPTLTIVALAIRLADHVNRVVHKEAVPEVSGQRRVGA